MLQEVQRDQSSAKNGEHTLEVFRIYAKEKFKLALAEANQLAQSGLLEGRVDYWKNDRAAWN